MNNRILTLFFCISIVSQNIYGYDWDKISYGIYRYQLKKEIFKDPVRHKIYKGYFASIYYKIRKQKNFAEILSCCEGDTLYFAETNDVVLLRIRASCWSNKNKYYIVYFLNSNDSIYMKYVDKSYNSGTDYVKFREMCSKWEVNKLKKNGKLYSKYESDPFDVVLTRVIFKKKGHYKISCTSFAYFPNMEEPRIIRKI